MTALREGDGELPAALSVLADAVHGLCAPRVLLRGRGRLFGPSLYQQLRDELAGSRGVGHSPAKSLPPVWIDALQLLDEIDTAAVAWQPGGCSTPDRLSLLERRRWRPQDCRALHQIASTVLAWTHDIDQMLNPPPNLHLTAACPSCNTRVIYRRDSAGDTVRQPALKIVADQGCTCLKCGAFWAPSYYMHLCNVLGFELPEGVLE